MPKRLPPRFQLLAMTGVGFFLIFTAFSYLVHKDLFTSLDFNTTVRLQDNIPRRLDDLFSLFSEIGKFEISLIVLIAIFAFSRKLLAGIGAIILFAGFHFIELFGKFFVDHTPPPQFLLRTKHLFDFPQFHVRSENSYPSGHAGRTMFLSVILVVLVYQSPRLPKSLKLLIVAGIAGFDITMLVSRVYLGEHWTTDVIGGAILGAGLGLISGGMIANFPAKRDAALQDKSQILKLKK